MKRYRLGEVFTTYLFKYKIVKKGAFYYLMIGPLHAPNDWNVYEITSGYKKCCERLNKCIKDDEETEELLICH